MNDWFFQIFVVSKDIGFSIEIGSSYSHVDYSSWRWRCVLIINWFYFTYNFLAPSLQDLGWIRKSVVSWPFENIDTLKTKLQIYIMANKDSEINSILLVIAMEQEALPLVRSLNLEMLSPLPFPFGLPAVAWKGKVGRSTVHLIWCGRYVLQYFVFYIFEYHALYKQ